MLDEIYTRGTERQHREFSIERLLVNMRETRLLLKDIGYLNHETRLKLQNTPPVIIDLNKDEENEFNKIDINQ